MFQRQNQQLVLDKISEILDATAETHADALTTHLDRANRIFIAGAGRSKLVGNFLAMRLMHGGYDVSVVGEIVTPSIREGDLLVTISGSGETEQLIAFTKRARSIGAEIVLITAAGDSSMGDLADQVFQIGTVELYGKVKGMPMGTVFELSTLCFFGSPDFPHHLGERCSGRRHASASRQLGIVDGTFWACLSPWNRCCNPNDRYRTPDYGIGKDSVTRLF